MRDANRPQLRVILVLCLCTHFCIALHPARGRGLYPNSTCTSLNSPLCTRNGSVDPCLQEVTLKEKSECLQNALEAYYGPDFTETCTNFATVVSSSKCTGCPWDRINVSALLNARGTELPLPAELFHIAADTCSIANHVKKYNNWIAYEIRAYTLPVLAGLILVLLTGLANHFVGRELISRPVWMWGREIAEWLHLSLLWILLFACFVTLSYSEDYFSYCETSSSFLTQRQLRAIAHGGTLAYSFSRCLCLPSRRRSLRRMSTSEGSGSGAAVRLTSNSPQTSRSRGHSDANKTFLSSETVLKRDLESGATGIATAQSRSADSEGEEGMDIVPVSSWYSCLAERRGKYRLSFAISGFFVVGCRLILLGTLIYYHFPGNDDFSSCSVHYMDYNYVLYIFAHPVLEILVVAVYATGPQRTYSRFILRSIILTVFLVGSIVLATVQFPTGAGVYQMFPGLDLDQLTFEFVSAVHAGAVCLLGLFEPIRLGIPAKKTKT